MIIFKTAAPLTSYLRNLHNNQKQTGFVPTMGALHQGHISLVERSKSDNDITICSIFINPTQFNNKEDFTAYPVTIEKDIDLLVSSGCDVLFLPSVAEVYPNGLEQKQYELGEVEHILEGAFRPQHFQGVCQVVDRLLDIVPAKTLYLGQKDFQQCMVVRKLLEITGRNGNIHLDIAKTIREEDGLAMSSRNLRLDPEQRQKAVSISKALTYVKEHYGKKDNLILCEEATLMIEKAGLTVDYVSIRRADDLSEVKEKNQPAVVLAAATVGNIRLIDNMLLN